jgi:hypothetical protein
VLPALAETRTKQSPPVHATDDVKAAFDQAWRIGVSVAIDGLDAREQTACRQAFRGTQSCWRRSYVGEPVSRVPLVLDLVADVDG